MRCHICDRAIESPQYNRDHQDWDPCGTCLQEVNDLLEDFVDVPFETEVYDDNTYYQLEDTYEGVNDND